MLTIKWRGKPVFIKHRYEHWHFPPVRRVVGASCATGPKLKLKRLVLCATSSLLHDTNPIPNPQHSHVSQTALHLNRLQRSPQVPTASLRHPEDDQVRTKVRHSDAWSTLGFCGLLQLCVVEELGDSLVLQDTHPHILICLGVCTHLG